MDLANFLFGQCHLSLIGFLNENLDWIKNNVDHNQIVKMSLYLLEGKGLSVLTQYGVRVGWGVHQNLFKIGHCNLSKYFKLFGILMFIVHLYGKNLTEKIPKENNFRQDSKEQ